MNFGTPVPLLIGIVLIVGAVALFFLDKLKPGYGRDSDKVYAILWLISGVFLLGHLTMELLASFQQLMMAGMLISVTIENILSRAPKEDRYVSSGPGDAPARGEPYRPSRPPSYRSSPRMNVRAELEDEPSLRGRYPDDRRVLSGRDDRAGRRPSYYGDEYPDQYVDERGYAPRSNPPAERPVGRLNPSSDRIRRRRPKAVDGRYDAGMAEDSWDEQTSPYSSSQGGYSSHSSPAPSQYPGNGSESDSYVDYRPVDPPRDRDDSNQPSADYGGRY